MISVEDVTHLGEVIGHIRPVYDDQTGEKQYQMTISLERAWIRHYQPTLEDARLLAKQKINELIRVGQLRDEKGL